ncbi:twin-arginine translocase TatA/TatE family subunit [Aurantiacibacter spongiae]|uniref:Sec-independent protein translocase protein TatA n=1 Tax=Aurantiacibacter spongiae TaxID=2488860 RepID=A0A3N5CS89_9SPHN|nr:twin-arginine translocase TatA/TatE family subunit [Aurantiacibacter spongiae]RPF72023.1 twin-arginine translocase TatA/TatE family subunit [Aurantiacibacter spongiae]
MSLGPVQLLIIAVIILVLFGRGRISEMMGDFGKGISSFKKGMNEEAEADRHSPAAPAPSARIEGPSHPAKPAGETVESNADKARDTTNG